jgi:hypothetical protein
MEWEVAGGDKYRVMVSRLFLFFVFSFSSWALTEKGKEKEKEKERGKEKRGASVVRVREFC